MFLVHGPFLFSCSAEYENWMQKLTSCFAEDMKKVFHSQTVSMLLVFMKQSEKSWKQAGKPQVLYWVLCCFEALKQTYTHHILIEGFPKHHHHFSTPPLYTADDKQVCKVRDFSFEHDVWKQQSENPDSAHLSLSWTLFLLLCMSARTAQPANSETAV